MKNKERKPADLETSIDKFRKYIISLCQNEQKKSTLLRLLSCSIDDLENNKNFEDFFTNWLCAKHIESKSDNVFNFLTKLDTFNLNDYIGTDFNKIKVPTSPVIFKNSKSFFGIEGRKKAESQFLITTLLSKSEESIFFYSDLPISQAGKDEDFKKNWVFAMTRLLKKGLHLNMVHNLNRPVNELLLGLENWIPIYMTGSISPYYLTGLQNSVYCHFNYVSGTIALTGECIKGYHNKGKYHLTSNKTDVAYYRTKAECLLNKAKPLMDIYRVENRNDFDAFISSDASIKGNRRRILSSLPIHTISDELLLKILKRNKVNDENIKVILDSIEKQRQTIQKILENNILEDEIVELSEEEFVNYPPVLSLSDSFYTNDICYNYEEYLEHLTDTKKYMSNHNNYKILENKTNTFRNINITIHPGKWVMISKNTHPAIHFVIHHPKLRDAIENFIAPVVE